MEYAISVIVPIYKAENYLPKCIESILSQTFHNFQLILVDDGSPDLSGEICDRYAQLDTRIEVIHKQNGGVMSARKCGILSAQGIYSIQIDPDDWVEVTLLEDLYQQAIHEDADMVICDFVEHYEGKAFISIQKPESLSHTEVMKEMFTRLMGSTCNKLIRTLCYKQYNVNFFEDLVLLEDLFLMFQLLLHPLKVAYVPKALYHYERNINPNSLTMTQGERFKGYADSICKHFRELLKPYPEFWNLWVEKEMPWIAYLSLYYNVFNKKRFLQEFSYLDKIDARNQNERLVKFSLKYYMVASILMVIRRCFSRVRLFMNGLNK
ncbi:glycosyltransferase family 2 protein [Prevotella histicola]|jgi:capsular polysaccharide biosynthesis protein cpsI|uniref:glycosyltransferase family 2 protein n=1 Tax=Prevotella histicola TaxID=470565 RepID=UPI001C5D5C80|nr:glycosyltransferase family 2 protein [Prevotella histicola]MBW4757222.1 glycosyltransferase [Prevotella histicola]